MGKRTKRAFMGFATDVGGQAVMQVATLVAVPIILCQTSETLYGFWITILSILGYLGLVDLGLGVSLSRIVAGFGEDSNKIVFNRAVSTAFFSFCFAGLGFLAVGLSMAPFIPAWFKIPPREAVTVLNTYKIAITAGAIALPMSTFGAILAGTQHMAVNNLIRDIFALVSLSVSLALLYFGQGLTALALGNLFNFCGCGLANYIYARKYCPHLTVRISFINRADLSKLWKFGGYFQLGRVASIIAGNTDAIVIAAILGAASVAPYTLTAKMATLICAAVASKLANAAFPALSQMFAQHETDNVQRVFTALTFYSVRLAIVGAIFVGLANGRFVELWVGKAMFGGSFLNAVFVFWVLQDTVLRAVSVIVLASGDLRHWAIVSIAEAALNIGATLLLIGPLGLPGVAIATAISRTLTTVYVLLWACRKLQFSLLLFFLRGILQPTFRSALTCIVVGALALYVPEDSRGWYWLIAVGGGAAILNLASFEGCQLICSKGPWQARLNQRLAP